MSVNKVLVTGAAGRTGRYITLLLANRARGLVRQPAQGSAVLASGGEALTGDLLLASPQDRADWLTGCEAVVFAGGRRGRAQTPKRLITLPRWR